MTMSLIKVGNINVFPATSIYGYGLEDQFKEEIKAAGEFLCILWVGWIYAYLHKMIRNVLYITMSTNNRRMEL